MNNQLEIRKEAASAGHVCGLPVVAAEAFI